MIPKYKCPFCVEVFEYFGNYHPGEDSLVTHMRKSHEDKFKCEVTLQ